MNLSPALVQLRDWARDKSTEIQVPLNERALWKQIADEVDTFAGWNPSAEDRAQADEALF